jgi:hypothetical protein
MEMQAVRDVGESTVAFGANLLGAMVGGVVEYLSLVVGYRALLLVAAALYALAFAFSRRPHDDPEADLARVHPNDPTGIEAMEASAS